jgi:hypothetical protein
MFVGAAGKDSGSQLHARLQQDLIYWKAIALTLTPDWTYQLIEPGAPLFMKFQETRLLVEELDREHYAPAVPTLTELRDFWVSQPLLYDRKWGMSISATAELPLTRSMPSCSDWPKIATISSSAWEPKKNAR